MRKSFAHIKWMPVLMTLTILCIAGFQFYWLEKAFEREERTLVRGMNMAFRETVFSLQATKLKLDKGLTDSVASLDRLTERPVQIRIHPNEKMVRMVNVLGERIRDSVSERTLVFTGHGPPDSSLLSKSRLLKRNRVMQFLYDMDDFQDSVRVKEIDSLFRIRLDQQNIEVPFRVQRLQRGREEEKRMYNEVTIGFRNPVTYQLQLGNTFTYVLKRISGPVLLSLFLVAFTIVSFSLLYRNLLYQRRLAVIKNDFISNITHELKTPIATVSVAIEALRSFNASMDAQKTKEYLDISANELQRLSLLVDKVLKLSIFENREVDLKYEPLDMQALAEEVMASMRLQFERHRAAVNMTSEGQTHLQGDRLHLVSVIFNLLDNALKYSREAPEIEMAIRGNEERILFTVHDNGIGIPAEYKDKIFDKFFRVPTGNVHNAKGYGLGLSYVSHVVEKHGGSIKVESAEKEGSTFTIALPVRPA